MNNKGQTLVLFLFIIPVILAIFLIFYQLGIEQLEKRKMIDTITTAIEYGLEHQQEESVEEDMIAMFQRSFPRIPREDIWVQVTDESVRMQVSKDYQIIFLKKDTLELFYRGEKIDGKVQIVKE